MVCGMFFNQSGFLVFSVYKFLYCESTRDSEKDRRMAEENLVSSTLKFIDISS